MTAVHFRTAGMHCPACPPRIERELLELPGVTRVVALRDLGITSVAYDEGTIDIHEISARISAAGFHATVLARGVVA